MGKLYVAYGSNLSVDQMEFRCPDAGIYGTGVLQDWRLAFGRHATIERWNGVDTPVLVWEISEDDEKRLDRYEGYPTYYVKETVPVLMDNGETVKAMVYIMTEIQKNGVPTLGYVGTIWEGYEAFGFDTDVIVDALKDIPHYR